MPITNKGHVNLIIKALLNLIHISLNGDYERKYAFPAAILAGYIGHLQIVSAKVESNRFFRDILSIACANYITSITHEINTSKEMILMGFCSYFTNS
jgi:hypothetical protein